MSLMPDLLPGCRTRWLRIKPREIQSAIVDFPMLKSRTASVVRTNSGMIPAQRPGATGATVVSAPVCGAVLLFFMDASGAPWRSHGFITGPDAR